MHQYCECDGNIALATARLLTGHGESLQARAARWWDGDDVTLLPSALTYGGGTETKGGNLGLTIEQRDAMRAAGFDVPWPVRFKNTDTINTPRAALTALLGTIPLLEAPMPATTKLFDVGTSIAVASGKGGVGKTTVAAALAKALTKRGKKVLTIDLDFHGPSLGHLLGLGDLAITDDGTVIPTALDDGTRAISLSQFLTPSSPVTWRGTAVEGFLLFLGARLDLTGIDTIIFDLPPGTGDVERAVMKYARPDGAVLVTTGSGLSHADCRRAGMFLQHHRVPIVGVVENLSRRTVTTPGGETIELRIFGEESDTVAFTEGLAFYDGFGQRYAPNYLGSLPFSSSPDVIAASPEFAAVVNAAEACEPEKVDPNRITSMTRTLTMTVATESADNAVSKKARSAHMAFMTSLRDEAQNSETSPERLHELIHLPGNRGDGDSDASWCREDVAANPSASLETLRELATDMDDCMARRNAANNPVLDDQTLWMMIDDEDDITADAARKRLGLIPKPRPNAIVRAVHIPQIDPKTGRVIKP